MTEALPLVSVVIPVFNGANYLRQAIDSALGQSYPRVEVIVVDDGSTDGGATRAIIRSYEERVIALEKSNGGVATALNAGIQVMRGDLFSWLSHDDLYYPHKLSRQVDFFRNRTDGRAIVFSHEDRIDAEGRVIRKAKPYSFDPSRLYYELLFRRFIGGCSLLIPRSAFDVAGLFDPRYRSVQDYDLWFRMAAEGYTFAYCPITSGMSRIHAGQDSRSRAVQSREEQQELFINAQQELPASLWIDTFKDKARAYYRLAYQYGLQGLYAVRRFDLHRGDLALRTMPVGQRARNIVYRVQTELQLKCRLFLRALRARLTTARGMRL